ncbi:MAG: hypothetical protein WBV82_21705 [Myxococcaceae bacterium]
MGTLTLEDGATLRFGRSACRGFEPVVGAEVTVRALGAHPLGGWRALEIVLDAESSTYDDLLAARDAALGRKPSSDPVGEAAATCLGLGWIVVLLNEPPPTGPDAFRKWAGRIGLDSRGIRVSTDGQIRLGAGRHDALTYVGAGPFPRERLAELGAPEDFDPGQGFIGLSLGLSGQVPLMRLVGNPQVPWGPQGGLRDLSRIALALLEHGRAVILPQAGTVVPADRFRRRVGDVEDLDARPFGAWMGWALDPERRNYATFGMCLHGLPDVELEVDPDDRWQLDRALEALLVTCQRMVRSNQPLSAGDIVEVPVGAAVGAYALEPINGDAERYRVGTLESGAGSSATSARISLQREGNPGGTRALWQTNAAPTVAFNTYRELFLGRISQHLSASWETKLTPEAEEGAPVIEVDVLDAGGGAGFYLVTNGVGRVPQPGGTRENGTAHVELIAAMSTHHPLIAPVLATVAQHVHRHDGGVNTFKAGDTVGFAVEEIGAAGFVLGDAGRVALAEGGPPVHLLELIPLNATEYDRLRKLGSGPWLAENGEMDPRTRAERWRLLLH